jgi:hypothetical protein
MDYLPKAGMPLNIIAVVLSSFLQADYRDNRKIIKIKNRKGRKIAANSFIAVS